MCVVGVLAYAFLRRVLQADGIAVAQLPTGPCAGRPMRICLPQRHFDRRPLGMTVQAVGCGAWASVTGLLLSESGGRQITATWKPVERSGAGAVPGGGGGRVAAARSRYGRSISSPEPRACQAARRAGRSQHGPIASSASGAALRTAHGGAGWSKLRRISGATPLRGQAWVFSAPPLNARIFPAYARTR